MATAVRECLKLRPAQQCVGSSLKVLVTGGAGYVGSHACKALARAGHTPITYDSLVTGHREAVRWGPLVEGDIRDEAQLDACWTEHAPDLVMHFAALSTVSESTRDPGLYYDNNVLGSLSLFRAMLRGGTRSIVFSSSCAVYGVPDSLPVTEAAPRRPINPYGITKYVVEEMLADFGRAHGLNWMALRYFNAAGADPEGELRENHRPETHAIPLAVQAALGEGPAFSIFGTDYDTPDGSAVRDYVHVTDLAEAHIMAAEYLAQGGESLALNLGAGVGVSVLEMLAAVETVTGRRVPTLQSTRRAGDAPALYASPQRAMDILGWRARRLSMAETVRTVADMSRSAQETAPDQGPAPRSRA